MTTESREILIAIYNRLTPEFWIKTNLITVDDHLETLLYDTDRSVIFYSQNKKAFYRIAADGSGGLTAEIAYF